MGGSETSSGSWVGNVARNVRNMMLNVVVYKTVLRTSVMLGKL